MLITHAQKEGKESIKRISQVLEYILMYNINLNLTSDNEIIKQRNSSKHTYVTKT